MDTDSASLYAFLVLLLCPAAIALPLVLLIKGIRPAPDFRSHYRIGLGFLLSSLLMPLLIYLFLWWWAEGPGDVHGLMFLGLEVPLAWITCLVGMVVCLTARMTRKSDPRA